MELQTARQIIDTLAQGIHPVTGEALPDDSPYNAPPVIRALVAVSRALEQGPACTPTRPGDVTAAAAHDASADPAPPAKPKRSLPANAGKPWSAEDDQRLVERFDAGSDVRQLALEMQRTPFAVESRLVKLGKIDADRVPPPRYGVSRVAQAIS